MSISASALKEKITDARTLFFTVRERKADIFYDIGRQWLQGTVGDVPIKCTAYSGGGRGAVKKENISRSWTSTLSFMPATYKDKNVDLNTSNRGGPLPPGWWFVEEPGIYSSAGFAEPYTMLVPIGTQLQQYGTRDYHYRPFLIHGQGDLGSDGCLVISKPNRVKLLSAVTSNNGAFLWVTGGGQAPMRTDGNNPNGNYV